MAGAIAARAIKQAFAISAEGIPDEELLARFLDGTGTASEDAFRVLVGATGRGSWGSAGMSWTGNMTPRMRSRRRSSRWRGMGPRFAIDAPWAVGSRKWRIGRRSRPAPGGAVGARSSGRS